MQLDSTKRNPDVVRNTEGTKSTASDTPSVMDHPLTDESCRYLRFDFLADGETFDKDRFVSAMKAMDQSKEGDDSWGITMFDPQHLDKTEYHIHLVWNFEDDDDWKVEISYHVIKNAPEIKGEPVENAPYAETAMSWLGQFFKVETANVAMDVSFEYKSTERQSRYLLPVKVRIIPDIDTTIDGVSIDFPDNPDGVTAARLTVDEKSINIWILRVSKISFRNFDLREQVRKFSALALRLTEEKKS